MLTHAFRDHINSWFNTHRRHIPFFIPEVPKQEPHPKTHISLHHRLSHSILFIFIYGALLLYYLPNQTGFKKNSEIRIVQSRATNKITDTNSTIIQTSREKPIHLSEL
jgi:hypothetical protein